MAQSDYARYLKASAFGQADELPDYHGQPLQKTQSGPVTSQRPPFRGSAQSEETIRATATPPIEIPGTSDLQPESQDGTTNRPDESFMDHFMRTRKPSISFATEVTTESGHRQSIDEPLSKTSSRHSRGRSVAEGRHVRSHSESERSHYDPVTGRHLPKYSSSPPREHARIGEARFPLLQTTVDAMARESQKIPPQALSLTTESTLSPVADEICTPQSTDNSDYITSPTIFSPGLRQISSSYDVPRLKGRTASQRWRDGEAAQDFFSRAGSVRKGTRDPIRRSTRRDTASAKSPHSAASSFLKTFSLGSGSDDQGGPLAVDAEGSTIGEDYVLGKQIGYGGFSIIREVTQLSSQTGKQRTLAVKIVRRQLDNKSETENEAAQAEFEHEVELWRLLNHRHILALEAVYKLDEATFCFIPLNLGGTLFDLMRLNRQGLDPELAANYTYQICSALRYLHLDARVVHRDIKLENCLIDSASSQPGLVRLCDFGMAEWISNDSESSSGSDSTSNQNEDLGSPLSSEEFLERRLSKFFGPADTSTSAFAGGSLEYAAPEILRIATHSTNYESDSAPLPARTVVSPAVDIWALGVCLFTLLMGKRPFADSFQPRIVMSILAGEWDVDALLHKSGKDATRVVKQCLQDDARKRADILEVMAETWFDGVRAQIEKEDEEDETRGREGSKSAWRL